MNIYAQRIMALRMEMQRHNITACLILTSDPHLSEYIPNYWKVRKWLSGFNGSAGTLIVTQEYAGLWTDGRYWIQAQKQLEHSGIELQKATPQNTYTDWLVKNITSNQIIATDGRVLPYFLKIELLQRFATKKIILQTSWNGIESIWHERPSLPQNSIYEHELKFCGYSRKDKIDKIRQKMNELDATIHLISSLDDIAWILNLRGSDVPYNPVFLAHLLIMPDHVILFANKDKFSTSLLEILQHDRIIVKDYNAIQDELVQINDAKILIDPHKTTAYLIDLLCNPNNNCINAMQDMQTLNDIRPNAISSHNNKNHIIEDTNPSTFLKSCKTETEINHIQEAMRQDGIALCNFFVWLEDKLAKKEQISELDIGTKLSEFRSKSPLYISDSFNTIAGFNANGAQPHYSATTQSYSMIDGNGLLLIDSGGQYLNGTTDITRVVPIGNITQEQKRDYTLVLKANIAVTSAIFPEGLAMPMLDCITRLPLWQEQLDYIHGTGHGVGYFLNVHEGPQVLSYYAPPHPKTKAYEGMITSIEPGIYRANKWGIRLENLVVNKLYPNPKNTEYGRFLYFEVLTLCPFDTRCILTEMLTDIEKQWLNTYHAKVFDMLSPYLDTKSYQWLQERTKQIALQ